MKAKHLKFRKTLQGDQGKTQGEIKKIDPLATSIDTKVREKLQKRLENLVKEGNPDKVTELVVEASELKPPFAEVSFYRKAFDFLSKFPGLGVGVHVESVGQSAAIAYVKDQQLYLDMVDFLLTPKETVLGQKSIQQERVVNACRILASISVSNEEVEDSNRINVPEVFKLAMERLLESEIQGERRLEEKADRIVEVYEQALAAGVDPETGRELYENVFRFVIDNETLSKEYKLRTLMEITRKAIKAPGLSHTELFTAAQKYFRENGAATDARTIIQLLRANKK